MKRILVISLSLVLALAFAGCGENSATEEVSQNTEAAQTIEDQQPIEDPQPDEEAPSLADPNVDIDLTAMSSTFIYSEVYNMMMAPTEYEGKIVKMEGNCGIYVDEQTGKTYYACIVRDATQCCAQGLEFVLDEDEYTESDYPSEGEDITVKGEFSTYEENGGTYLTMKNAVME